MYIFEKNQNRK